MKEYKLSDVRIVCEGIYGKKIADVTWRKWRSQLGFEGHKRTISQLKMEQLLTYTYLKRTRPYDKITLLEVIEFKAEALQKLKECCTNNTSYIIPDQCKGHAIGGLIEMVIGRKVSERTLYRWGAELGYKFSTNTIYKKIEIQDFISKAL